MRLVALLTAGGVIVSAANHSRAQTATAVVPATFASRPGDTPNLFPLFPGAASPLRYQQVFKASDFPPGPITITQIAFRPDSANSTPFSGSIPQIQVNLSTTHFGVDSLSTNFADNLGADLTVVYPSAPLTVASAATNTGIGTRAFDLIIRFVTPFTYDPSRGNLLLEADNSQGGTTAPFTTAELDASISTNDTTSRLVNFGNASAASGFTDSGGAIVEFTYTNANASMSGTNLPPTQTVPDHIVVVMFENHAYSDVIGNSNAPTFTALAAAGANFIAAPSDTSAATSGSHAVRHPSQPNYLEFTQATIRAPSRMAVRGPVPSPSPPRRLSTRPTWGPRCGTPATALRVIRKRCLLSASTATPTARSPAKISISANTILRPIGLTIRTRWAIICLRPSTSHSRLSRALGKDREASPIFPPFPWSFPTSRTTCTMVRLRRRMPG